MEDVLCRIVLMLTLWCFRDGFPNATAVFFVCKWSWFLNNVDTSAEEMKYENCNVNIFNLKSVLLLLSNIHTYISLSLYGFLNMLSGALGCFLRLCETEDLAAIWACSVLCFTSFQIRRHRDLFCFACAKHLQSQQAAKKGQKVTMLKDIHAVVHLNSCSN